MAAGDVPALAPVQQLSGSLRLSLMQRAPNAVRDFVAASNALWRSEPASEDSPTGSFDGGRCASTEEVVGDVRRNQSCVESDPVTGSGARMPPKMESSPTDGDGMDALGVLADAVECVPQSPPAKLQPKGIKLEPSTMLEQDEAGGKADPDPEMASSAATALATISVAANAAADAAGADVEFTLRELQILAKELER